MSQPRIFSIVEGPGDVEALPILIRRWLQEVKQRFDLSPASPKNAKSRGNLTTKGGIEKFLKTTIKERDCGSILILIDADEECPKDLAVSLAKRASALHLPVPVAIVCAKCEYEAWFLASLETIAGQSLKGREGLPTGLTYDQPVEEKRGVKEWLSKQMSVGRAYKETQDQAPMTALLNFGLVRERSRSFRRLEHALNELLETMDNNNQARVTPDIDA